MNAIKRTFTAYCVILALAARVWDTLRPVSATVGQCKLDCAAVNTTSELVAGGSWSIWDTQRLVGPTRPSSQQNATYPYARSPFPLMPFDFCQLGCSFFFATSSQNTSCKERCDDYYARNVSVGISDSAEKVRTKHDTEGEAQLFLCVRYDDTSVFQGVFDQNIGYPTNRTSIA